MKLVLSICLFVFAASAAFAVDYRWTTSLDQGTLEAIIENVNDSTFNIYCPEGQEDTTPGMFIDVKRIKPKAGEQVTVQIVVDGDSHAFELNETQFLANSRTAQWQFRDLVLFLTASKRKSFTVEFPKYRTAEAFSLLDARKALGHGKGSILQGCGVDKW